MTSPGATEPLAALPDGAADADDTLGAPASTLAEPEVMPRRRLWQWLDAAQPALHVLPDSLRGFGERRDPATRPFEPRRGSRRALIHSATHDSLTDLPNRSLVLAWLHERTTSRTDEGALALLYIDLDRFKQVNDSHGHSSGDAVLVETARRLTDAVRSTDIVARLGGDEFVIGLTGPSATSARHLARRLLESLRTPHRIDARDIGVTASIGIAFAGPEATADSLLRDADAALYRSKGAGRNRCSTFDDDVRRAANVRSGGEADLRLALARAEIFAHYQPIFDLRSGEPVAAEALARWDHPARGLVSPTVFVPMAEESGLILPLGDAVLDVVTVALGDLDRMLDAQRTTVWINVSSHQLEDPSFARRLVARIENGGTSGRVGIEVSEHRAGRDVAARALTLVQLEAAGLLIALEDVGIGYPSLARLARNPVHTIKIDRSFVEDLSSSATVRMVAAVVELAHSLGALTRAEGIETAEQLAQVRELGIDLVSGFLLGRPDALDRLPCSVTTARQHFAIGRTSA